MLLLIFFYLSLFFVSDDLRSNFFKERGDDAIQTIPKDPLKVLARSITRLRAKKLKDTFSGLI
jgi:hypothetical protein